MKYRSRIESSLKHLLAKGLNFDAIIDVGVQNETDYLVKNFNNAKHFLFDAVDYSTEISNNYKHINHVFVCGEVGINKSIELDNYFSLHKVNNYLIKIDVDGGELDVITSGLKTLKDADVVIIEATTHKLIKIAHMLNLLDLQLFDICDICYYNNMLYQVDLVFIKKSIFDNFKLNVFNNCNPFDISKWDVL